MQKVTFAEVVCRTVVDHIIQSQPDEPIRDCQDRGDAATRLAVVGRTVREVALRTVDLPARFTNDACNPRRQ